MVPLPNSNVSELLPRPYRSDELDLPRMLDLIRQRSIEWAPEPYEQHVGDLIWARYLLEDAASRWHERVLLWERGDELAGFSLTYPKNREIWLSLTRDVAGDTAMVRAMLGAAAEQIRQFDPEAEPTKPLFATSFEGSEVETALLSLGLTLLDEPFMSLNARELRADELLEPTVPASWEVRSLSGPVEYEGRVNVHRESFAPSKVTVEAYARLRSAPGYDPELDVVAVGPEGEIASFAIAWFDAETKTALFEPVGSLAAFRRRGLTQAVLTELLRRLQSRGASQVFVNSEEENDASNGLYRSAGFTPVRRWRLYKLPTGGV